MQVDVSMSLETTGSDRIPVFSPRSDAEERRVSRDGTLLLMTSPHTFSRRTRKALYSGVQVLGSMADGVSILASGPAWFFAPANPQWIGKPICQTSLPSTFRVGRRFVTI